MAVIRNKLNQRLIINLCTGKNIDLPAKGRANVSEKEFSSPHLQTLIARADVALVEEPSATPGTRDSGGAGKRTGRMRR